MKKKIFTLLLCILIMLPIAGYSERKPVIATDNTTTPYQAEKFLKDRNATKEMINCIPFIYEYCEKTVKVICVIHTITQVE